MYRSVVMVLLSILAGSLISCTVGIRSMSPTTMPPPPGALQVATPVPTLSMPTIPTSPIAPDTLPSPTIRPSPAQPAATPTPSIPPTARVIPSPTVLKTPTIQPASLLNVLQTGGALGRIWTLADIRSDVKPNYVRVVWEMKEKDDIPPRFQVTEVLNAEKPPPGGPVPTLGQARIDVILSDVSARGFPLRDRLARMPGDNPLVTKIDLLRLEDDSLLGFAIGLKRPAVYEIYTLTDPVRIVVDVLY